MKKYLTPEIDLVEIEDVYMMGISLEPDCIDDEEEERGCPPHAACAYDGI